MNDPIPYRTAAGLGFWMDDQPYGRPLEAPTIRTEDPDLWICFVPTKFRDRDAWLLAQGGRRWLFVSPAASSALDSDAFEVLRARNPGLDLVISEIVPSFPWIVRTGDRRNDIRETIHAEAGFRDRAEQARIIDCFRELVAPAARGGPLSMRGHGQAADAEAPGRVGMDVHLQSRLDAGDYLLAP